MLVLSLFISLAFAAISNVVEPAASAPPLENGPSGTYHGAKTVVGMQIDATVVQQDANHMGLTITGAVSVDCSGEEYTYSNGVITITNIDKSGDCLHDALSGAGVTLKGITYDEGADTITVTVKYLFLTEALTLTHQSDDGEVVPEPPTTYGDGPSGTYHGDKTVLGMKIDATVVQQDANHMGLTISGAVSVDCSFEQYSYANGVITITNLDKSGDCLHDALAGAGVTLKSITYDEGGDTITVTVGYLFFTEALTLTHQSDVTPIDPGMFGDGPSGTYHGEKTVVGMKIDATVVQQDANHMGLTITGAVSVDCSFEQYSYANGVITITNLDKSGDCLHDALAGAGVTLKSITYDEGADTITVTVKYLFLTEALTLTHQSNSHEVPAAAPKFLGHMNENPMAPKFKILTTKINPFYIQKLKNSRNERN